MSFETRLWRLGNLITLVVVLLAARLVYWSLVRADDLRPVVVSEAAAKAYVAALQADHKDTLTALKVLSGDSAFGQLPQPVIQRTVDLLNTITRGTIYDRNGHKLAFDQQSATGGPRTRVYTEPSLAHVLGYVSGIRAGISGLELTYNSSLLGLDRLDALYSQTTHQPSRGSDLVLTIDAGLQRTADQALAGQAGAAVVIDASTGAVLAMASQPDFDPNRILDPAYTTSLLNCSGALACQGVFINRAMQGLYTPGSTFKTVTLIAGLDTGQVSPATIFDFGQRLNGPNGPYYAYTVDGAVIPDPNHVEPKLNLEMSYARSANAAFARIGNEMPAKVLIDYAGRFDFSVPDAKAWKLELPWAEPQLASDTAKLSTNNYLRATTAIGQGELLANPLSMALVVLAVVNHGNLPLPYLVETVRDAQGKPIQQEPARQMVKGLMKPATADLVRGMMVTVVTQGSGKPAAVQGLTVGGKTGTAQLGDGEPPHAWFIGFAQGISRTVVIAVVVENAGEGHDVAAPIFARLADAAIHHLGEPVAPLPASAAAGAASPAVSVPAPEILRDPRHLNLLGSPGVCPPAPAGPVGSGHFVWPVDPKYRQLVGDNFTAIHPGIDLGANTGAPVYAADAGLVVFASWTELGYGNVVMIDHGNGFQTVYGHLSQIQTSCGAKLKAGQLIGLAGATGNAFGPHLHFEIRVPGGFVNPYQYLPPQ